MHAQCPSTRSTPNATLAQSRSVAVPGTHLAITSFPAAVSGRSVAGLKGVGGAVHCSGLHRLETAQAALGTFVLPFFIVGFGSTVFFGPPFPEYIRSRYTVVEHRVARWLQIKRHSIDAGDTRANWTTARDPEPQRRRSKTLLPPFLSETNGLREGARAYGHPIPSQPGPDPTWGGRQRGGGGARRLGFWKAWDSGGGHTHPFPSH